MSRTRVVNIKTVDIDKNNPDHVYIGRANKNYEVTESKWANPFKVGEDGTREQVIQAYREWIKHQPELLNSLEELRGKILFCWCCPEACHGHVLVELLEGKNELKIHPAAELFPPMTEAEFLGLKEDIREHGQREDIVVWQGQLIDGRHRLRACRELGIEPQVAELMDETDPWQYVVSHNLHRRHLTTAQRAMVADKLASRKQGEKKPDSGIPLSQPTQAEAAKLVNVSVDSVKQARKIRKTAKPETVAAVERGEITLNAAVATVKPEVSQPEKAKRKPAQQEERRDMLDIFCDIKEMVVEAMQQFPEPQRSKIWPQLIQQVTDEHFRECELKPATPPTAATAKAEPEASKASHDLEGRVYSVTLKLMPYLQQLNIGPDSQPKFSKALKSLDEPGRDVALAVLMHLESVVGLAGQLSEILKPKRKKPTTSGNQ